MRVEQVYCAHEYTASNAKFAIHVNPNNEALRQRQQEVAALRDKVRSVASLLGLCYGQADSGVGTSVCS